MSANGLHDTERTRAAGLARHGAIMAEAGSAARMRVTIPVRHQSDRQRRIARARGAFRQVDTCITQAHACSRSHRTDGNYTRQRPKIVENCGDDIELKARSQPMGTLWALTKDGCGFDPILPAAGASVSRSPLSVRSTSCGFNIIPTVLGNEGNETRTIKPSAVTTIAHRTVLRINPSHL
jgi:hypothetical protein